MKNFLYTCCALLGLINLTNCTKENVAEPDKEQTHENSTLTATIEDVTTKTHLEGKEVFWKKGDKIAIQLSSRHRDNLKTNSNPTEPYATTFGVYKLADVAADKKVGQFIFDKEDKDSKEEIDGNEEFFAFYPASFCSVHKDNGYFYFEFPQTQKYEDVIGEKFPLPMYGIGKDKKIEFKYAGAVIKLKVWSHEPNIKIKSCVITADGGLNKKAFTNINKNENNEYWESLQPSYNVNYLTVEMDKNNPITLSTDESNPTVIPIVVPLAGERKLTNLKFSINCTTDEGKLAGCELKKTSGLTVTPGTIVNFPTRKIKLDYIRMVIDDEVEGEFDIDEIKKAEKSIRLTAPDNITIDKATFKEIIEATKSLSNTNNVDNIESPKSIENNESSNRQIIVDLSGITAADDIKIIYGPDNGGFCGSNSKENGIKNISELYLPKGITTIMNLAFANSEYTKIVLPATLTKFSGRPGSGSNLLKWEVAEGNKIFWTDKHGALYGNIEVTNEDKTKSTLKTLVALNGGSGATYRIQNGTQQIGSWCMYENSVLTTLVLPNGIQKIGENGLARTTSLTTIIAYGAPIFKGNSGSNKVGKEGVLKTLYVAGDYYQQYMDKLSKINNWDSYGWRVLNLSENKPPVDIPAENPAKKTKTN